MSLVRSSLGKMFLRKSAVSGSIFSLVIGLEYFAIISSISYFNLYFSISILSSFLVVSKSNILIHLLLVFQRLHLGDNRVCFFCEEFFVRQFELVLPAFLLLQYFSRIEPGLAVQPFNL